MQTRPALALIAITFASCPGGVARYPAFVLRGGVEVVRVGPRTTAAFRGVASDGDYVLTAGLLRAVVAGPLTHVNSAIRPGAVPHVSLLDQLDPDDVQSIAPLLVVEGVALELDGAHFASEELEGRAALVLTASARAPSGAALRLRREYSLDERRGVLVVRTRVEHTGGAAARGVAFGARLEWGARTPFAPGVLATDETVSATAPWVARASSGAAFAWTQFSGDLALRFVADRHESVRISGHTDALSAPRELLPGRALTHDGLLLASQGDLVGVARAVAAARGERVRETPVIVTGFASDERALVAVEREDGSPVLAANVSADEPRALPLPEGEYVARAYAPGHAPGDPVRFLARDGGEPVPLAVPPGGRVRFVARDAASGADLPVRIVLRGIFGTPDPSLGPPHEAAGATNAVVAASGRGEITVPPGRYELAFSHGPEWTVARARATVSEILRGDVEVQLSHALPMADWTSCDLHVHARPSFDSEVSVEDRVASLVAVGVEFATPTEHNIVGDYGPGVASLPPAALAPVTGGGLLWVPAVEVTTDEARQPMGHFNVYPYRPDTSAPDGAPPPFLEAPRHIFRAARANNPDAFIQVNHPRMSPTIGYFTATRLDPARNRGSRAYSPDYDAIEVFNGFYVGDPEQVDAVFRDWLALLGSGARYVGTASSDSHMIAYHQAGYPRTYVYTPGGAPTDPVAVVRSLRAGHAFGTSGPMLFLESPRQDTVAAIPGDTVRTAGREVPFTVRVMAAPWIDVDRIEIYQDGVLARTFDVPASEAPLRLERSFTLPVRGARGFVIAVARGDRTMEEVLPQVSAVPFAFTNPIWLERGRP